MIGIAASNIHGRTIHSFAGIGLGTEPAKFLAHKILTWDGNAFVRWTRTNVLIIDEGRKKLLLCGVHMHSHLVSSIDD